MLKKSDHYYRSEGNYRPNTIIIKLQIELEIVLFFKIEHLNDLP